MKTRIGANVSQGKSNCCAIFQLESSMVRVRIAQCSV